MTFGFNVSSIDEAVKQTIAHGGSVKRKPQSTDWGVSATILDPDGNTVLLTEKTENRGHV